MQGIPEGTSCALRPASSSAASFPGRNKCPGTHCSLIEQQEKEDGPCQSDCGKRKDGAKDKVASVREEKRNGRLVGAAETSKKLAEWRRLQRKTWNILDLRKWKEWPQCHRESSWQIRQSLCQKEQNRLSSASDGKVGEKSR